MRFDLEKIFEDYAFACECATTHHPVEAARYAADMVNVTSISVLDAAIRLYRDDWFMYAEYGIRFPHFYQMVCYLVK